MISTILRYGSATSLAFALGGALAAWGADRLYQERIDKLQGELAACEAVGEVSKGLTYALDEMDGLDADTLDGWLRRRASGEP